MTGITRISLLHNKDFWITMYSMACRDTGMDCDWFYRGENMGEVIMQQFKHAEASHKEFRDWIKGKLLWQVMAGVLTVVKDDGHPGTSSDTKTA
jgi:predicted small metal-binding protein